MLIWIIAILLCVIAVAYRLPVVKGVIGELRVRLLLGKCIPGRQYVIHDLLFADEEGNSCQIDHIYINPHGVWVIETKNYVGRIYGSAEQREWTQVLAYGKVKNRFYSPLKQNATHIRRLSQCLGREGIFHNIVCFANRADLSRLDVDEVCKMRSLSQIKKKETEVSLTAEDMALLYASLCALKEKNTVTKKQHVAAIEEKEKAIRAGICPRCGGRLVPREGKNGRFLGCSNFPTCRFTKKN